MATTYTTNTPDFLKSGANCAITDCTTYDSSSYFTTMAKPLIGDKYNYTWGVICTRFKVTPSKKIKSISLAVAFSNKAHGTGNYVDYYYKASTSASAWPTSNKDTGGTRLGQLADSGIFTLNVSFAATDDPVYIYVWGYLNSDSIGEHTVWLNNVSSISAVRGGASLRVKTNGTNWATSSAAHVKTADGWKEATAVYVKTADGWKEAT